MMRRLRMAGHEVLATLRELRPAAATLAGVRQELAALRGELAELRRAVESIRVHTWIDKEAGVLAAQDVALEGLPRYRDPRGLTAFGRSQMYSQNGEDGVIAEVLRRIGSGGRRFVEIGCGDGRQNNTRLLLETGWRGVWIDGDSEAIGRARRDFAEAISAGRLAVVHASVTRENVGALLAEAGANQAFDVLSIDVDLHTGHVWEAVSEAGFRPRVACVEYNASVPPSVDWQVPYVAGEAWTDASNRFGAGLKTLERLGRSAGMSLVGCEYLGNNAFFVCDQERGEHFLPPFTAEHHYEPPRYGLLNHRGHPPADPRPGPR